MKQHPDFNEVFQLTPAFERLNDCNILVSVPVLGNAVQVGMTGIKPSAQLLFSKESTSESTSIMVARVDGEELQAQLQLKRKKLDMLESPVPFMKFLRLEPSIWSVEGDAKVKSERALDNFTSILGHYVLKNALREHGSRVLAKQL